MRLRPLRFPDCKRPFWLLVALAVALLINVSTIAAPDRSAASLVELLGRDLGALRIHLEELVAEAETPGPPMVASSTEIGDGSPAFRARAMATLMRSAHRRVDRLIRAYARAGRDDAMRGTQMLKIRLHELEHRIDRLVAAGHQAQLHNAHMRVRATLDRVELDLATLGTEQDLPSNGGHREMAAEPESLVVQNGAPPEN